MKRRRFLVSAIYGSIVSTFAKRGATANPGKDMDQSKTTEDMRGADFPYPVVRVPGKDALAVWTRMKSEGGTAVVIGGEKDFVQVTEFAEMPFDVGTTSASILAKAEAYVFPDDYRARMKREDEESEEWLRRESGLRKFVEDLTLGRFETGSEPAHSDWPDQPPEDTGLTVKDEIVFSGRDYTIRPYDEVFIATLPTQDWTEAFAYLQFGGWNSCPFPHEQVAAFRYWTAKYDLELVGMSADVLNLRPRRLPETREEALMLAREQYDFCPDLVDQGEPLEVLAAGLMAGNWWYFWWD